MLGLASTVSSSSTPESKYSLDFDGADDFLDTGATFNTTFAGDFSISMWVKPDDGQNSVQYFFGSANSSVNDSVRAFISSGKVGFILEAHDSTITRVDTNSTVFSAGAATSWTHLGFMANIDGTGSTKTTLHVYVNGVQVAQSYTSQNVTGAEHSQWESDQNLAIGDYNNNGSTGSNPYNGKITDFAIWNARLDDANFLAIYNSGRPTNLTFDSGNYNQSSALQAYYKMGNGSFDDKANGVIHDQNSSGFESSSLYASNYTSGVDGWTGFGEGGVAGNIDGIGGVDNCLRYTSSSTTPDTRAFLKSDVLTIGKVYKVTFSYYIPSGSNVDALILDTVAGADNDTRNTVTDAWATVTEYFTALTADIKIVLGDADQYLNPAATNDIAYIKDVSVANQKIGAGFGAEAVDDGDFPSTNVNWTIRPSTTINGGSATITGLGSLGGSANNWGVSQDVIDIGVRSYKVTFTAKQLTGTGAMYGGIGYHNIFSQVITSDYVTYTFYQHNVVTTGNGTRVAFGGVLAAGGETANTFEIKDVSVKQLNGLPALTSDANESGFNFSSDAP